MTFAAISMIYAGTILFFVGTTALILLAWVRLCGDARGRDGGLREELAARVV
jgi:hypothetical protein